MLTAIDPDGGFISVRTGSESRAVPLSQFRRLTLTVPLTPVTPMSSLVSGVAQEREYRLKSTEAGRPPMVGRTFGYVQAREGMYLFPSAERRPGVQRVFVPRCAFSDHQFGPFAEDIPGLQEISDPVELLRALERQQRLAVQPLGHSLLQLRLVTPLQLEKALAKQSGELPLGEMLVNSGVISRPDLERALAHKMGYPFVDLNHFPIEPIALKLLTLRAAIAMRVVPLMLDGERLVIAVSKMARANKLRSLPVSSKRPLVPVLAPKHRILEALTRMSEHAAWDGVPLSLRFFATTS